MYPPACDDEITTSIRYLDEQLTALRAAVYGLTEEQARSRPCRSELSVGGLLKHVTHGMNGVLDQLANGPATEVGPDQIQGHADSFVIGAGDAGPDESTARVVAIFDEVRRRYLEALAALDPNQEILQAPAPWDGILDCRPANARYVIGHQIEEMARHAGHADILREQIDGIFVPALVMTLAGVPANPFFEPYAPNPAPSEPTG